ncbi:MAG: alanine--tRNA ligase [Planctomycetaceae bacterium]|nr:alanine--tRNA ligase [Planctomycetaceae bacterium]
MKTDELREKYLDFFVSKGCTRRPSDVLVPRWDPSVLFTPAGMNQFKDHFLGRCKLEFTRAATCQKCLRTGDIDNVGRTAYHHTFFEMLGNFSFGDYFKREAIHWAWEFLTDKKWLGLSPDRLSATVYLDDDEAAAIWIDEIKLPAARLQRLGEDENFWPANAPSQGPDGVCGPCSEIYYHTDFGEVEIWNLVFTQFNRVGDPPDNLRPLPSKNIDTGMGLERTAAVLQGVETNFHIDIFRPLVEAAAEVCGQEYEPGTENGRRLRRIADHIRACAFAVHENVYPGPNKEKYVIKRLLRRAVLDGHQMGVREPFLHKLVPVVAQLMQNPYPELSGTVKRVAQVLEGEEANFLGTIDGGLARIEKVFAQMKSADRGVVSGAEAAEMYQTYGVPPELFEAMAAEHNFTFDWAGYRAEMVRHGEISGTAEKGALFQTGPLEALKKVVHTTEFLGYEQAEAEATVAGIIAGGKLCDQTDNVGHAQPITVVLNKTPFYGEKGGQVGDHGEIVGKNFRFEVTDTQVDGELVLHLGHLREGKLALNAKVTARVDESRRQAIRRAHSATHLLHHALRKHLGQHAEQQGSKVDADWLRFDFTNPKAVPADTLAAIEAEVNVCVTQGDPVACQSMTVPEARQAGAVMLFGEKYPDVVRVVSMGDYSKELCGGTHLTNTGQVGLFKIVGEESVSAGTRRITALTGAGAVAHVQKNEAVLSRLAATLKIPADEIPDRVAAMAKEIRELKKKASAGAVSDTLSVDKLLSGAVQIAGTKVIAAEVSGANPNVLRQLIDQLRRKASPVAAMLAAKQGDDKVMLVAGLSRDLVEKGCDAVAWVKAAAVKVQGSGGGRPDMAQAGGKKPEGIADALAEARTAAEKMLG